MAYEKSRVTDFGRGKQLRGFEYCHQISSTPSEVPSASDLRSGEIAINAADGKLFYLKSDGTVGEVSGGGDTTGLLPMTHAKYVIAKPGDDIQTKYTEAASLSPTSNSRVCLLVLPGTYTRSGDAAWDVDYVDVIGLGSVKLRHGCKCSVFVTGIAPRFTASHVYVKGISTVGTSGHAGWLSGQFVIGNNKPNQVFEDCEGGSASFGGYSPQGGIVASGTYINCTGGNSSFGAWPGVASGTFVRCLGASGAFGGLSTASGVFDHCKGAEYSFGSFGSDPQGQSVTQGSCIASGTFIGCEGGDYSFGSNGTASGTFRNCTAGDYSFGGSDRGLYGYWYSESGANSVVISPAKFLRCDGGNYCFGSAPAAAGGVFTSGSIYYCTTTGEFNETTESGKIRLSLNGSGVIKNIP